jgi:hypothetical protein
MSLRFLIKVLLIKGNFILLSKAPRKVASPSPCSPKWGPNGYRCPVPEPYVVYPSRTPVKEPFLQVSLLELPQREMLFPEPSIIPLSKSLVNEPPCRFPAGPLWREVLSPEPSST